MFAMPVHAPMMLFDAQHLGALAAIIIIAAGLSILLRSTTAQPNGAALRRGVCRLLGILLIGNAVFHEAAEIRAGTWTFQNSMPLHLCDFATYIAAFALFGVAHRPSSPSPSQGEGWGEGVPQSDSLTPTLSLGRRGSEEITGRFGNRPIRPFIFQFMYELAYFWGIGGTVQALLTPDIHDPFPTRAYFGYFAGHGGIMIAVFVMTVGLGMRPLPGAVRRVWLATHLLAIPVGLVNWAIGSNYMFLCGPPQHPSAYDYFGRWPWSLLTLEALLIVMLLLCYAPFWWRDRRRAEKTKIRPA